MRRKELSDAAQEHLADQIRQDVHSATVGNVLIDVNQNGEITIGELLLLLPSGREVMVSCDRDGRMFFEVDRGSPYGWGEMTIGMDYRDELKEAL